MNTIESLDGRRLFSASIAYADGVLTIVGTSADEHVNFDASSRVRTNKAGSLRAVNSLKVTVVASADREPLTSFTLDTTQLTAVHADLGGGDDALYAPTLGFLRVVAGRQRIAFRSVAYDLDGGAGNDTLVGGTRGDTLRGGAGDDAIDGGNGDDALYGGDGDDKLHAGNGDDSLFGDAGDDLLYDDSMENVDPRKKTGRYVGASGVDHLDGGAGTDSLWTVGRIDHASGIERAKDHAGTRAWVEFGSLVASGSIEVLDG